ncbi:rRNA maturation RNase YbeY [Alkanindiges sp. WGS2144]|uniref:rRNA maturation RNase YbeY n=1 Tax=Alkanindiges sp. WGS2144 TaxID=3366808 RepID=UPI0037507A1E
MNPRLIKLGLQQAYRSPDLIIKRAAILKYVAQTLGAIGFEQACDISIRLVDNAESHELNLYYRHKDKPTNVLSFPSDLPDDIAQMLGQKPLGDLVICLPVVLQEAAAQQKTPDAHFAHMVVHGILHLMGYDHELGEQEATQMEAIEVTVLQKLGFSDPYSLDQQPNP